MSFQCLLGLTVCEEETSGVNEMLLSECYANVSFHLQKLRKKTMKGSREYYRAKPWSNKTNFTFC